VSDDVVPLAGAGAEAAALVVSDRDVPATFVGKLEPNYYCRGWNEKRKKYCHSRAGTGTTHPGVGRCRKHGGTVANDGRQQRATHGRYRRYGGLNAPKLRALIEDFAADPAPFDVRPELDVARALFQDWIERYEYFVRALSAWYDSWEGKYTPINEHEARSLVRCLDELEVVLNERDTPTPTQEAELQSARTAVKFLGMPRESRPRQVLDVAEAIGFVDKISKVIHRAEQIRQHGSISLERVKLFMLAIDRVLEIEVPEPEQRDRIRRAIAAVRV
jgi:hypothetical protein